MKELRIALAGNPNVGKTTIFNALTGSNQHVGNWPGKTVEKKMGRFKYEGYEFELVDLPGTYSLSAFSLLELEVPSIIVLNMIDMAEARGFQIDIDHLRHTLQTPIVTAVARKGRGIKELKDLMVNSLPQTRMPYEFA
jgi:ferrous iron transport protein B